MELGLPRPPLPPLQVPTPPADGKLAEFSVLTRSTYQGRPLTREEMMGFANLTFAGGRDTIIHTLSSVLAYLAGHPEALEFLRQDPARTSRLSQESARQSPTS